MLHRMQQRSATPSFAVQALMFAGVAFVMLGNYYGYDSIAPVAEQLSRELHFTDTQIGTLNAIYSLPNIFLVVIGGVLVDRFSARLMVLRRRTVPGGRGGHRARHALSGDGHRAAAVRHRLRDARGGGAVALAQWFAGRYFALLFALNLSLARLGSYLADRSPSFAGRAVRAAAGSRRCGSRRALRPRHSSGRCSYF